MEEVSPGPMVEPREATATERVSRALSSLASFRPGSLGAVRVLCSTAAGRGLPSRLSASPAALERRCSLEACAIVPSNCVLTVFSRLANLCHAGLWQLAGCVLA